MAILSPTIAASPGLAVFMQLPCTKAIGEPPFRWEMGRRGPRWIFNHPEMKGRKLQAELTQESMTLRDLLSGHAWALKFDAEGYVLGADEKRFEVNKRPLNALIRTERKQYINFWRALTAKDPLSGAKREILKEFCRQIAEGNDEKIYTTAVPDQRGTIGLKINGEVAYLWGHALRHRKGKKIILVKEAGKISIHTSKNVLLYEFKWDKELKCFYRDMIRNGQKLRSYIVIVPPALCLKFGGLVLYFSGRTVQGVPFAIEMDKKRTIIRVLAANVSTEDDPGCRLMPIKKEGKIAGYNLGSASPPRRKIKLTGEIQGEINIRLRKGCYYFFHAFGNSYTLPLKDGIRLGLDDLSPVDLIIENNIVTGVRSPKNNRVFYYGLVRDKHWNLLCLPKQNGSMIRKMRKAGKIVILEHRESRFESIRQVEVVTVDEVIFTLRSKKHGSQFKPMAVSAIMDFKRKKPGERIPVRIKYWIKGSRFSFMDKCKAVVTLGLPYLPAGRFVKENEARRLELAERVSRLKRWNARYFISGLEELMKEMNCSAGDAAHILDIVYKVGQRNGTSEFNELHLLFGRKELGDLWIPMFYIMLAHEELKGILFSVLENADPSRLKEILSKDDVLNEVVSQGQKKRESEPDEDME